MPCMHHVDSGLEVQRTIVHGVYIGSYVVVMNNHAHRALTLPIFCRLWFSVGPGLALIPAERCAPWLPQYAAGNPLWSMSRIDKFKGVLLIAS